MNWIFLNKNNNDGYIEMFAQGSGASVTCLETWQYEDTNAPLVLRGIMKHKIIKRCWQDRRWFYYMDTGYLGNRPSAINPLGSKHWHRVVPNNLQHNEVVPRPADRWQQLGIKMQPQQKHKRNILIVAPDEKPCSFYGTTLEDWMRLTVDTLKQHTDRPIVIRERPASRWQRKTQRPEDWLADTHAVVTFNSSAASECILAGVPVFVTSPFNAALQVSNINLDKIETPWFPSDDERHAWACHLAYGQFHIKELANGSATRILKETYNA